MSWALVTGGSSGMGLEYARQLADRGYDLILVSNQEEQLQQAAADLIDIYGVNAVPHYQDLATPSAAADLLEWCDSCAYEVEILICNAGMFFFQELTPENSRKAELMLNLHMITNTRLCILFGDRMKRRGHGRILIMSSMASVLPTPGITIYSATKAYLRSFGKSLWFEMKPYGVSVTTVCPAAIATPLYGLKPSLMKLGVNTGLIWTARRLVRRAIRAMFRGRRVYSPGFMNIYVPVLLRLLPARIELALWKRYK